MQTSMSQEQVLQKPCSFKKCYKVMLSVNLCVQYGLFNKAMGIVRDIIFKVNTNPLVCLEMSPFILENPKFEHRDGLIVFATT